MKKAIILTGRGLSKPGTGEYYKVLSFVTALKNLGYQVSIASTSQMVILDKIEDVTLLKLKNSKLLVLWNFMTNFPTSIQRSLFAIPSKKIQIDQYDLVVCSLVRALPYKKLNVPTIVDLADILSVNFSRQSKIKNKLYGMIWKLESILLKFDEKYSLQNYKCTVVSKVEHRLLTKQSNHIYLLRQPAPITLQNDAKVGTRDHITYPENYLLFIGPYSYGPNREVLEKIDKILNNINTNYQFLWIGSNSAGVTFKNIKSLGFVPDIKKAISGACAVVAITFTQTGVQGKLLDALYCGSSVITHVRNKRAIDINSKISITVVRSELEFATALSSIKCNKGKALAGLTQAQKDYGLDAFTNRLAQIIALYR